MTVTRLVPLPQNMNAGIKPVSQATLLALLGNPGSDYGNDCAPVTNQWLAKLIVTEDVGPFRVTGLKPAIDDLRLIFTEVKAQHPDVYSALGSSGMLCVRLIRGSSGLSRHSWGVALDINLDGVLDSPGNALTQEGLARIAPNFNTHGWYWGAAFGREDAMHFEVGSEKLRSWHDNGVFEGRAPRVPDDELSEGDRGPEVRALQEQLRAAGHDVKVDGVFGPVTRAALMSFQASHALLATGILDDATQASLAGKDEQDGVLRQGSVGPAVTAWQTFLLAQGYSEVGEADGRFGPATRRATSAFQKSHGLAADGVVGPLTLAEAERHATQGSPPAPPPPASAEPLRRLSNRELTADIIAQATRLLREHYGEPIGTEIPFVSSGQRYIGRLEWHYNQQRGKHKGFSTFVPKV